MASTPTWILIGGGNDQNKVEEVLGCRKYAVCRVENIEKDLGAILEKKAKPNLFITNLQHLKPNGNEIIEYMDQMLNLSVITMDSDERMEHNCKQLKFSLYVVEAGLSMNDLNIILGNNSKETSSRVLSSSSIINANAAANINGKKPPRFIWTDEMINKFEYEIDIIEKSENQKATPMKILQRMGVPGLRRESVASRLQTYRMKKKHCDELATKAAAAAAGGGGLTTTTIINTPVSATDDPFYNLPSENIY